MGEIRDGDLWAWVRSVLSQGAAIQQDYAFGGKFENYEQYSARLDAAACERADSFAAVHDIRVKSRND